VRAKSNFFASNDRREGPPSGLALRRSASDSAIVFALREGRPEGAALLFARYRPHVLRVIVHALGPDRELHDLIQEVFLAAMDSIADLRDPRALKSWIGTIAIHTARRRLRQRKQQRCFDLYPADDPPERADHSVPDPEIGEAARATFRVLDALSEEDRLVFLLRHVHGWKMSDIAELCGASLSTVKRRLARATGRFTVHARREASLEDLMDARDWTSS